jgi:hypothetical protein
MKKVLLIIVLSLITTLNYAQGDSSKRFSNGVIGCSCGFFGIGKYTIDGKQATRNEVYASLLSYPVSAIEFEESRKYKRLSNYAGIAAISFLLGSIIANGGFQSNTVNRTPAKILLGVGYAFIVPDVIFGLKRNKHLKNSVALYNQQFH